MGVLKPTLGNAGQTLLLLTFSRLQADPFSPHLCYLQSCFSESPQTLYPHLPLPEVYVKILWIDNPGDYAWFG